MDPKAIAVRYLKKDFVIDLAATLPMPQVKFLINSSNYGFRVSLMFPLSYPRNLGLIR